MDVQLNFASFFRTTFSEFAAKHARDTRFKAIEKMKDRETIFTEFMTSLRKKEKENSKNRGEKVSMISIRVLIFTIGDWRTLMDFSAGGLLMEYKWEKK